MKKLALVALALLTLALPAQAGRRFNKTLWQVPQYIQTHTNPYLTRVAIVYPSDLLRAGTSDATVQAVLKAYNTRLGSMVDELRERGVEVHYYDTETLMDSTSAIADAAGEQGQPIWNTFGDQYPVTFMVGFRSQFDGTLNDRRPWYKAYSTNTHMIHLVFNTSFSLYDNAGTTATSNCGTGAFSSSFATSSTSARVCTYYGDRDTLYGRNLSFVTRVPDSTLNADIYSIVRLLKPVASTWTHTSGKMPSGDDSVATANELLPLAYRVYWKVPGQSTQGRWVDYVLMGTTADDERVNWQHIAVALAMRYTKIPPLPVGWIDADDNGNFGLDRTWRANTSPGQRWPTPALLDSIVARSQSKWGVVWNWNGPADSMAYYRNTYGYSYLNRMRYGTAHSHDTVATHVYANLYGKGSGNSDTTLAAVHSPRTAFVYAAPANRTTDDATRNLGIFWRLTDHKNQMRNLFNASGLHYLNTPNADGLPLGVRVQNYTGYGNTNGNGNCPVDSFYMALAFAGVHDVATGFEFDYQPDSSTYYMHNMARGVSGGPKKFFAYGDESWTGPPAADPMGRFHVTGEERTVKQVQWYSVSEVTPQAATTWEDNANNAACTMLGLRRGTWMRPQPRTALGETAVATTTGAPLARAHNMAFSRVRATGLHPRNFTSASAANCYGDWWHLHLILNHFSVMNSLAGRTAYRFTEPWMTRQGIN